MKQTFTYILYACVVIAPIVLYIKSPQYWIEPIMEHNLYLRLAFKNGRFSKTKATAVLGLMTALTVILAGSSLYFPVGGHLLCHFAALFIAVSSAVSPRGGLVTWIASVLLLLSLVPSHTPVLALVDGPLGFLIGWNIANLRSRWLTLLSSALAMAIGIMTLSYILGIPAFPGLTSGFAPHAAAVLVFAYCAIYSWAWITIITDFFVFFQRALMK